jgi:hypothetical protein
MLLDGDEFRKKLEIQLKSSKRCFCYSAFFTEPAIDWFMKHRKKQDSDRLLIRALPADFLAGACSFAAVEKALSADINLKMSSALHAKIYAFDEHVYSGSANLTAKGLALSPSRNDELGTSSQLENSDLKLLENLWLQAVTITENTLAKMKFHLEDKAQVSKSLQDNHLWWPQDILTEKRDLYCSDFPQSYPTTDNRWSNLTKLQQSQAYNWLQEIVKSNNNVSFGFLSRKLHDKVYDDPSPYRQDIKTLLANLLALVMEHDDISLEVIRPRHSQVVKLRKGRNG